MTEVANADADVPQPANPTGKAKSNGPAPAGEATPGERAAADTRPAETAAEAEPAAASTHHRAAAAAPAATGAPAAAPAAAAPARDGQDGGGFPPWGLGLLGVALVGCAAGVASPALGLLIVPLGLLGVLAYWLKEWQAQEFGGR